MSLEIYVRADALCQCATLPPVILKYARHAVDQGGLTVGAWLCALEDGEIDDCIERIGRDRRDEEALLGWSLFAVMLANGEGLPVTDQTSVADLVRRLCWLLQLEMLRREGMIDVELRQASLESVQWAAAPETDGAAGEAHLLIGRQHLRVRTLPLRDAD